MEVTSSLGVLVVDDSAAWRLDVSECVRRIPGVHVIGSAPDGARAVEMAGALQPGLILLDVEMPVMDGLTAIPDLRRVAPDAGIIMVSGLAGAAERARTLGAFDFVTKPRIPPGEDGPTMLRASLERAIHAYVETRPPGKALL